MKHRAGVGLSAFGLAALFLALALLTVLWGARCYLACAAGQRGDQERRTIPAALSAGIRSFDTADSAVIRQTADGPLLELADGDTGYALRYYRQDGQLYTDYAPLGAAPDAASAQALGATERFEIERLSDTLLCITTDGGRTLCCLRSGGGAP